MKGFRIFIVAAVLIVATLALFSQPSQVVGGSGWGNRAEIISWINYPSLWSEPVFISTVNLNWRTVAEPSTMLLFGVGLIGLAAWGRRKIKQ